jgi:6-phosphogluconate dehydrogenase
MKSGNHPRVQLRIKPVELCFNKHRNLKKEGSMDSSYSLGIVGLGVMGRSLALNFERNGFPVIGYDISPHLPADFPVQTVKSLQELGDALKPPRIILMMVPAGDPVDTAIFALKPFLSPGDVLIDGGNSYFEDTERRVKTLAESGVNFVGMGVSGGESGALWGPSLMPGGTDRAWESLRTMLQAVAAKAEDGTPCVAWMGSGGAGHYVKMVHNGIEYGDMQLIAEVYDLLHRGAGISNADLAGIFAAWNEGELKSYLVEITSKILKVKDDVTGQALVDLIVDEAAQKGTGKWASQNSFDVGIAIPTINASVESRLISAVKTERVEAARALGSARSFAGNPQHLIEIARHALYSSKVMSYAQGFSLLRTASKEYNWNLDLASIARIWRAGCIIRADLLDDITAAFTRSPDLANLMMDEAFARATLEKQAAWRETLQTAIELGIPMPAVGASLAYFDAYRSAQLPANLIQAQRDYFGAHTYHRVDQEGSFHTDWEKKAGS